MESSLQQPTPEGAVETHFAAFWLDEHGIVYIRVKPTGTRRTLEETKEMIATIRTLGGEKPRPVLLDARGVATNLPTRDARLYFTQAQLTQVIGAWAVVYDLPVAVVLGKFFTRLNKPAFPIQLFNSEAQALAWLKPFLDQQDRPQ